MGDLCDVFESADFSLRRLTLTLRLSQAQNLPYDLLLSPFVVVFTMFGTLGLIIGLTFVDHPRIRLLTVLIRHLITIRTLRPSS